MRQPWERTLALALTDGGCSGAEAVMTPLVAVEALGKEAVEEGRAEVGVIGGAVSAEAGRGGGGPAGPPSGIDRIGVGDRLRRGKLTGIGVGGPAGEPVPRGIGMG